MYLGISFLLDYIHLHQVSVGGPGWTRTNDVSKVTDLQSATLAARLLTHILDTAVSLDLTNLHTIKCGLVPGIRMFYT